jgi:hypothetical protein
MSDEDEVIKKDQAVHPNCSYRRILSQSCTWNNGENVCEKVTRVQRICPREQPVTVFSSTEKGAGSIDNPLHDSFPPLDEFLKKILEHGDMRSPPGQAHPAPKPDGRSHGSFSFSWGGSMVDDDSDKNTSGWFGNFGFGGNNKRPDNKSLPSAEERKRKPPGGTPVGPSEDI